ncbi:ABC-2 family transporter protein [Fictibacillus nanhaiensis]|uniref:ABC transporter permease n=1 Tax=Fictibacillus nanhaiensis TaxID=742169 RepID=UPI001C98A644|nr:ABC-2 family transporter protein [Fictibacillus nanhaiensis]MBY6036471.1 ABC-2 family transporter protein [Fictibacillus nanhaiensis]
MVYWILLQKSFLRNMQYKIAHLINNAASAIFGFVFIAIWVGVLEGKDQNSPYNVMEMTYYIAAVQCILWISGFLTAGLNIQNGVRNGAISLELVRPTNFFLYVTSQEAGRLIYNFFFRTIPIGLVFALTVGFYVPQKGTTYLFLCISIFLAIIISINLHYLVGISACWTTEIDWAHFVNFTLLVALGGQFVPIDFLPAPLSTLTQYLPFAGAIYYPVMILLEKISYDVILLQLLWAVVLTLFNLWLTEKARQKLEIQGG